MKFDHSIFKTVHMGSINLCSIEVVHEIHFISIGNVEDINLVKDIIDEIFVSRFWMFIIHLVDEILSSSIYKIVG